MLNNSRDAKVERENPMTYMKNHTQGMLGVGEIVFPGKTTSIGYPTPNT